jgi:hypothetical protein
LNSSIDSDGGSKPNEASAQAGGAGSADVDADADATGLGAEVGGRAALGVVVGGGGVGPPHADMATPSRRARTARGMPGVIAPKTPEREVRFRSGLFIHLDLYK